MSDAAKGELRGGYTTGACAAAGVKAALLFLRGDYCEHVEIMALDGTPLRIPVKNVWRTEGGAKAEIVKFSGDDPDITNGISLFTEIRRLPRGSGVAFLAGEGIGHVTKPGLALPVGEPAINPGPRKLIRNVVKELLGDEGALEVRISVPAGKELAGRTLNPTLGIEGGISVIGTTGVLRPMSEEGFRNALVPQIDVAKAAGFSSQVFVPGKIGENIAVSWGLPREAVIQTSNFIGFMLEKAEDRGLESVLLFGHPGKLAKVAAGVFHTHNRVADGRLEAMAAYGAAEGLSARNVRRVLASATTEEALAVLGEEGLIERVCTALAERASFRAERHLFGKVKVGTVMVTLKGELLGMDERAQRIGEALHWNLRWK